MSAPLKRNEIVRPLQPRGASAQTTVVTGSSRGKEVVAASSLPLGLIVPPEGGNLSSEGRADATRRYRIIEPLIAPERFRELWIENGNRKGLVIKAIVNRLGLARQDDEIEAWIVKRGGLSERTLYEWEKRFNTTEHGGPGALVRKGRCDAGQPRTLTPAAYNFILAAALPKSGCYGHLSVREIERAYNEERVWRQARVGRRLGEFERMKYARFLDEQNRLTKDAELPEVSYGTFLNWVKRIPEIVKTYSRGGEKAFSDTQEIISFRDLSKVQPLDYVVMDHRRLDLFCMVPARGGVTLARPWLTAAIDMRTRKWLAWAIVETPSSDSIATVLKRTFIAYGLPKALYWDNGKDFTCEWFEGHDPRSSKAPAPMEFNGDWRGVLDHLGIRVHHAIVRRARSKLIEPNFVNTANWDRSTEWWCGHKPSSRPEAFNTLVKEHTKWLNGKRTEPPFPTIEKIAELYTELLTGINERPHEGEGMSKITPTGRGWMCPNECWELLIRNVTRRTIPDDVLQFAFAKRKALTVRNGELQRSYGGRTFHYRLIENQLGLMRLNGCEVDFAYDPLDLETASVYYQNRFIGLVRAVELRRMGEESFVADEKDRQAARREVRKYIAAVHATSHVPGTIERMTRRREVQVQRAEPERPELPAALPRKIEDAARAAREAASFSFADAGGELSVIRAAERMSYRDDDPDDDTEFTFFRDKGGSSDERTS